MKLLLLACFAVTHLSACEDPAFKPVQLLGGFLVQTGATIIKFTLPPVEIKSGAAFLIKTGCQTTAECNFRDLAGADLFIEALKNWQPFWPLSVWLKSDLNDPNCLNLATAQIKLQAGVGIAVLLVAITAAGYYGYQLGKYRDSKKKK